MDTKGLLALVQISLLVLLAAAHGLFWLLPRPLIEPWLAPSVWFAQLALSIAWLQLGPGWLLIRVPLAAATIAGLFFLAWQNSPAPVLTWLAVIGASQTALAIFVWQAAGWQLAYVGLDEPPAAQRFSLKTLMVGVLAIALLVRIGQAVRERLAPGPPDEMLAMLLFGGEFALMVVATLWAVLSAGSPLVRSLVAAAAMVSLSAAVPYCLRADNDDVIAFAGWSGVQALVLAGSLAIVRLAGYRWMRRRSVGQAFQPDARQAERSGLAIVHTS